MKKNRKIVLVLLSVLLSVIAATSISYAFFSAFTGGKASVTGPTFSTNASGVTVVTVDTQEKLLAATQSKIYNDRNLVSDGSTARAVVRLTADINLMANLTITADVHVDLSRFKLWLNGYTLSVRHTYAGSFRLYGDGLVFKDATNADGSSVPTPQLVIDTPNAVVDLAGLTYYTQKDTTLNNVTTREAVLLNPSDADYDTQIANRVSIGEINEKYLAYEALRRVATVLADSTGLIKPNLTVPVLIADSNTATDGLFVFDEQTYFYYRNTAALAEFGPSNGVPALAATQMLTRDADLPQSSLALPGVRVAYASSDLAVLSPSGEVIPKDDNTAVTLTASVFMGSKKIGETAFGLTVVGTTDAVHNACGMALTAKYLSRYYGTKQIPGATESIPTTTFTGFIIDNVVLLPNKFAFGTNSVTLSYTAYDDKDVAFEDSVADSIIFKRDTNVTAFSPALNTVGLKVTAEIGTTITSDQLPLNCQNTTIVQNNFTVMQDFLTAWYPVQIPVHTATANAVNGYSVFDLILKDNPLYAAELNAKGVTGIAYSLLNNVDSIYQVGAYTSNGYGLFVAPQKNPSFAIQSVLLEVTFSFGATEADTVKAQIPIVYDAGGSGGEIADFLPYYLYFNKMLLEKTGGYMLESFTMPFSQGIGNPVLFYELGITVVEPNPEGTIPVSTKLRYKGKDYGLPAATAGASPATALDNLLTTHADFKDIITLQDLCTDPDTAWVYAIDKDLLPTSNLLITVSYHYKPLKGEWKKHEPKKPEGSTMPPTDAEIAATQSAFTVPGIVRYCFTDKTTTDKNGQICHFANENLYAWVYNNFKASGEDYVAGTDTGVKYVLNDWLGKDVTFTGVAGVTDYKGVEKLRGTRIVTIDGITLTNANVLSLLTMPNVEELNLLSCGLSAGIDNAGGLLAEIAKSTTIRRLNLSKNGFHNFAPLLGMAKLEELRVADNIRYGVNSVFYGSNGLSNLSVYRDLSARGISVYNVIIGNAYQLFQLSAVGDDYNRLTNLSYQNKLKTNASIENVYKNMFSGNPDDYGLSTSYTYYADAAAANLSTLTRTSGSITFSHVGEAATATAFTLTYLFRYNGGSITLTIEFPVERI